MAKAKKVETNLDSLVFSTPEQKVLKLLLNEATTTFNSRTISSRLKGVRGLGGSEGIMDVLSQFKDLGLVDFLDNNRSVRLRDDGSFVLMMKTLSTICELEGLKKLLEPISVRGILFGSRASGRARTDSDYDVFVVSRQPEEVTKIAQGHPLGKALEMVVWTPDRFDNIQKEDPKLAEKLQKGIPLWGASW